MISTAVTQQRRPTISGEQGGSGIPPDDDVPALFIHSKCVQTLRRSSTKLPPARNCSATGVNEGQEGVVQPRCESRGGHDATRVSRDGMLLFSLGIRGDDGMRTSYRYTYRYLGVAYVGGCTRSVHIHSLMTIDPRLPIMLGWSASGFHKPDRHRVHQARSTVRCSTSRMKGELHYIKNHLWGGRLHLVRTFLRVQ